MSEATPPVMFDEITDDGTVVYSDFCAALCAARANIGRKHVVRVHRKDCPDPNAKDNSCGCSPIMVGYGDPRTCEEIQVEAERMVTQ